MGVPALIAVAGAGYSAYAQGQAGKAQSNYYNYLSDTAKLNAGLATSEAQEERRQIGTQEAKEQVGLTNRISATVGAQKASVVTGVGGSSRSAQDIIGDTLNKGNLDEMALRLNADIRTKNSDINAQSSIMNFGTQGAGYRMAGKNAIDASRMNQASSLLQGANSVASSYYMGQLYAGRGYGGQGTIGSVQ